MRIFLSLILLVAFPAGAYAAPNVAASIKPVHSLVSAVMSGIGNPHLLVDGAGSPHGYRMKPSEAAALERADIIFWVGHELETFLESPIENIAGTARAIALIETDGLVVHEYREGGPFEAGEDHGSDAEAAHGGGHDHAEHGGHELDAHIWLDPANGGIMATRIAAVLAEADEINAERYFANAAAVGKRLEALDAEIRNRLEPVKGLAFIVFHDGYQYFEHRYGLNPAGSITVNPEVMPGAERIRQIRERVRSSGAQCVFAEPQFQTRLVNVIIEGTGARAATLDPLGATLEAGQNLYPELLRNMADVFHDCLSGNP